MSAPEVWLRGPLPDVPALLQPAAHSLLQSLEELRRTLPALSDARLRARPGGAASVAYHAVHAAGSLDRLTTYARGASLDEARLLALAAEARVDDAPCDGAALLETVERAIERALAQIRATDPATLMDARGVGRGRLPSTVIGLLFHAAEHTQRHAGQAMTTARVVSGG